jgi:alkyl-hydroperoxide reductase/thiol specific antioxidant family protein
VAQLHHERDSVHGRGAELAVIGNGSRHFAEAFKRDLGLETPLFVDTRRDAYRALGMKRSFFHTLLAPRVFSHGLRAWRKGHRQKRVQGDPWQLGGVLVVLPGGRIAYRYLSGEAGDHPPVEDVLAAVPS